MDARTFIITPRLPDQLLTENQPQSVARNPTARYIRYVIDKMYMEDIITHMACFATILE